MNASITKQTYRIEYLIIYATIANIEILLRIFAITQNEANVVFPWVGIVYRMLVFHH